MKCPSCGMADLVYNVRDMPYIYKGEATVFAQVAGEYCPACGEGVFDAATSRVISADMEAFGKQVNAAIVDPSFISTIRKKLDLDQREAAEIFGGGANAFSRHENGKTKPPLALVKLFKVLDRHPDLLAEVRTGWVTIAVKIQKRLFGRLATTFMKLAQVRTEPESGRLAVETKPLQSPSG